MEGQEGRRMIEEKRDGKEGREMVGKRWEWKGRKER